VSSEYFHYRILVVDDDAVVRELAEHVLPAEGFDVRVAADGFEALHVLKSALPDLIIADLNMPRMTGFELLSIVRRRFPQIPVIAVSGEYSGPGLPNGLIADLFLEKGTYTPSEMLAQIRRLLQRSPLRASPARAEHAPLWVPVNGRPYYVLTCTECLRSFPVSFKDRNALGNDKREHRAQCDYCEAEVKYFLDLGTLKQASGQAS
jgi:CheY-like chemotaxis protein